MQTRAPALLSNPRQKAEDILSTGSRDAAQNGEHVAMSPVALLIQHGQRRGEKKTALLCLSFLIGLSALYNRQLMSIMALFSRLKDRGCT